MRSFEVRSPEMGRGEVMNVRYTDEKQGGVNLSPPLHIDKLPEGTQSVAWMLFDRDARDFVHWLVVDVPPGDIRLDEGASGQSMPSGARELFNDKGYRGYQGPNPPSKTGSHRYELVAYALDTPTLDIDEHAHLAEFTKAADEHALAAGVDYWTFIGR